MSEINFLYQSTETVIQCTKDDLMKDICQRFANKNEININDIYFIYNGNKVNENYTFVQQASNEDNSRNKMKILVYKSNNNQEKNQNIIKSNEIICSECKEISMLKIIDYQIELSNCKNKHTKKLFLEEYDDTQFINEGKIICEECKDKNKSETFNNTFYKCLSCKQNLCSICKINIIKIIIL